MPDLDHLSDVWHPKSENEKQLVLAQLEKLLNDPHFQSSKRYPGMLRFVVEQTLAGNGDSLKERILGIEVFHRSPDYDTSLDPVVRLSAAEVRKRIAQYYQSPAHQEELRIELNPGSYVPVFYKPPADSDRVVPDVAGAPIKAEARSFGWKHRPVYWFAGVLVAGSLLTMSIAHWKHSPARSRESVLDEVWSPLLTSSKPILFCIGETQLFTPHDAPLSEIQGSRDDDSFLEAFSDKHDFVPFPDVQTLSRFMSLIGAHGHAFRVQNIRTTAFSQLREGPVVLIGAMNNEWTLNRSSSLRFHLGGPEGPNDIYWIGDTQHPDSRAWQVSALAPRSHVVKDYAIVARFTDQDTGQLILIAAGIAGSGTRAAGEFLTDEASLKQLADGAPANWAQKNFEAVLSSQVVNGMQGKPKVVAKIFW
jgi:hypothetical protein